VSAFNLDMDFLLRLRDAGRVVTSDWLAQQRDDARDATAAIGHSVGPAPTNGPHLPEKA
jgi:hypothetical protein